MINYKTYAKRDYKLSPKAEKILMRCIIQSGENIHKEYNLYNITDLLEDKVKTLKELRELNLSTTLDVIKGIEYIRDNDLV